MGRLLGLAAAAVLFAGCAPVAPPVPSPSPSVTASEFTAIDTGSGTLFVSSGIGSADTSAWTERLRWAAGILSETDLGALDDGWDGRLDVELLTDTSRYRELAGADASAAAAVTRCGDGVVRVTVNPRILSAKADYLDSLLLHEGVHVATRSPCDPAGPLWVKEGLAEWVAARHSESTRQANLAWVQETLRTAGVPDALPPDASFTGDGESAAYALAETAVAATVDRGGTEWAMHYFQEALTGDPLAADTTKVTAWYREGLEQAAGSA